MLVSISYFVCTICGNHILFVVPCCLQGGNTTSVVMLQESVLGMALQGAIIRLPSNQNKCPETSFLEFSCCMHDCTQWWHVLASFVLFLSRYWTLTHSNTSTLLPIQIQKFLIRECMLFEWSTPQSNHNTLKWQLGFAGVRTNVI